MEEDYYSEPSDHTKEEPSPPDEGDETALLPLSIFPEKDLKVGSKCTFEVVSILEDEVEVKYNKSDKDGGSEEPEEMTMDQKIDRAAMV